MATHLAIFCTLPLLHLLPKSHHLGPLWLLFHLQLQLYTPAHFLSQDHIGWLSHQSWFPRPKDIHRLQHWYSEDKCSCTENWTGKFQLKVRLNLNVEFTSLTGNFFITSPQVAPGPNITVLCNSFWKDLEQSDNHSSATCKLKLTSFTELGKSWILFNLLKSICKESSLMPLQVALWPPPHT